MINTFSGAQTRNSVCIPSAHSFNHHAASTSYGVRCRLRPSFEHCPLCICLYPCMCCLLSSIILSSTLNAHSQIAVPIPVSNALLPNGSPDHASPSPWDAWNTIRHVCGYSNRLHLALNLTNPLPSLESLQRWQAESLRVIWLPASAFLPNAKGYPVLSKSHQAFLKSIVKV